MYIYAIALPVLGHESLPKPLEPVLKDVCLYDLKIEILIMETVLQPRLRIQHIFEWGKPIIFIGIRHGVVACTLCAD